MSAAIEQTPPQCVLHRFMLSLAFVEGSKQIRKRCQNINPTKIVVQKIEFVSIMAGFPQGLENRENREKNNGQGKVREKSGNFILGQKSGKSQGILF